MGVVQESYNVQDRQIVNLNDMLCLECSFNVISAVALVLLLVVVSLSYGVLKFLHTPNFNQSNIGGE